MNYGREGRGLKEIGRHHKRMQWSVCDVKTEGGTLGQGDQQRGGRAMGRMVGG